MHYKRSDWGLLKFICSVDQKHNFMIWVLSVCCTSFPPCALYFFFIFLLANTSQVEQKYKSSECMVYLPTHVLSKASPRLQAQNEELSFLDLLVSSCTKLTAAQHHMHLWHNVFHSFYFSNLTSCWQPWLLKKLSHKWFSSGRPTNWVIFPIPKCRSFKKMKQLILLKEPPDRSVNLKKFLGKLF